jgi:prevent-host-death family protein
MTYMIRASCGDKMETIQISEAKSHLSEYLSRAAGGERFLIMRRERPVAALIGAEELDLLERVGEIARRLALALGQSAELLENIAGGKTHPAMAAFGLWKNEADLTDLDAVIRENRNRISRRRSVDL